MIISQYRIFLLFFFFSWDDTTTRRHEYTRLPVTYLVSDSKARAASIEVIWMTIDAWVRSSIFWRHVGDSGSDGGRVTTVRPLCDRLAAHDYWQKRMSTCARRRRRRCCRFSLPIRSRFFHPRISCIPRSSFPLPSIPCFVKHILETFQRYFKSWIEWKYLYVCIYVHMHIELKLIY